MLNNKHYDTVTGYVFSPDYKRVLLVKKRLSGKIMVPGGHVKNGESLINALFREINEETGIDSASLRRVRFAQRLIAADDTFKVVDAQQNEDFIVIEKISSTKYYYDHIYCFISNDTSSRDHRSLEIAKVFWGSITDIDSYDMYPNVKETIRFYHSSLLK